MGTQWARDEDAAVLFDTTPPTTSTYGFWGISVFAEVGGVDVAWIAANKLGRAEWLVLFRAGDVLAAGLELWDTGRSPTTMW